MQIVIWKKALGVLLLTLVVAQIFGMTVLMYGWIMAIMTWLASIAFAAIIAFAIKLLTD